MESMERSTKMSRCEKSQKSKKPIKLGDDEVLEEPLRVRGNAVAGGRPLGRISLDKGRGI